MRGTGEDSISEAATENKAPEESFEELMRKVSRVSDPAYLPTISMSEAIRKDLPTLGEPAKR